MTYQRNHTALPDLDALDEPTYFDPELAEGFDDLAQEHEPTPNYRLKDILHD